MAASAPKRLRVLVVDDEPGIVDVVSMALRHHGFEVATVQTGAEALAQVRDWRPHAIVLDVMLPDMEGFEVGPAAVPAARRGPDPVPLGPRQHLGQGARPDHRRR